MEDYDNVNALFVEPNAYIQKFDKKKGPQKVVFQEPYEVMPNYYLKEDFKRKETPKENREQKNNFLPFNLPFDLKNLMPMLSSFLGKDGGDLSSIVNMLSNAGLSGDNNPLFSLLSNKDLLSNVFNMFKGKSNTKKNVRMQNFANRNSDYQIKNYTRVK